MTREGLHLAGIKGIRVGDQVWSFGNNQAFREREGMATLLEFPISEQEAEEDWTLLLSKPLGLMIPIGHGDILPIGKFLLTPVRGTVCIV